MMPDQDKQDEEIQRSIDCMFEDFDVDCDGKLVRKLKLFRSILFLLTHISFFFFFFYFFY
jgi:hypothetical protein